MKIMKWLKEEITKTPGYMRVNLLLLTTLMVSSVTSTALLIFRAEGSISDVNISGSLELREVKNAK